jgi:hypothetical protein
MSFTLTRRYRRRSTPARTEGTFFKKESQETFFGGAEHETFFQPSVTNSLVQNVQRIPEKKEEEKVHRQPEKKEEEKVMKMEDKKEEVQRQPEKKEEEKVQRTEDKKEEDKVMKAEDKEEEKVQKKEANTSATPGKSVSSYISSLNGKGNPMPAQSNNFFSSKMGYDFSNVKLHTDKEAAESAKAINAKAYTIGNNVVFNEGQYNTESGEGKKLMAHELTHVVQQNGNFGTANRRITHNTGLQVQRGFWSKVWGGIKSVGSAIGGAVKSVAGWGWDVLKSAGAWVWDFVTWMPSRMWSMLKHIGSGIVGTVSWLWDGFKGALSHIWDGVKGLFSWAGQGIEGFFNWIWTGIKGGAKWAYQLLQGNFTGFWSGLGSALSWLGDGVKGLLSWGWKGIEGLAIWAWKGIKGIAKWAWDGFLGGLAWVGRLVAKILDLFGAGELWTFLMNIIKFWCTRTLTGVEEAEARKVFGGSISYWQVRIDESSLIAKIGAFFSGGPGMGVTTGHTINFDRAISATAGSNDMKWLIHELTHVAQYTNVGLQYIGEALYGQTAAGGGYNYNEADLASKNLADYNREQQADIVENYYAKVLYSSTPYAAEYTKMRNQAVSGNF